MILGIDLGGMSAKAACLYGSSLAGRAQCKTSAKASAEETIASLAKLCRESAENAGVAFSEIEAIGVGAPGIIDEGGQVVAWTNFGWNHVPLSVRLRETLHKKVFVLNDANAAALGEAKFGAGKKFSSSILITLGTGVGGGIVLDGKIFEGNKNAGGEIGHMVIKSGGRKCNCGRRGCLESYASVRALIRDQKRVAAKNPESALNRVIAEQGKADGKTLFLALNEGDKAAEEVFSAFISALGEGILNLANLFRPEAVLIGGGISAQGERLIAPLRRYVEERLYLRDYAPVQILAASLSNDAGIYGAAAYAMERM